MAKIELVKNKRHESIYPRTSVPAVEGLSESLAEKQETLVSGKNIRTVNGHTLLGGGNLNIAGSGEVFIIDDQMSVYSENAVQNKVITSALNNLLQIINSVKQFRYELVDTLPEPPSEQTMGIIYLVPVEVAELNNTKDEYITIRSGNEDSYIYSWEKIGSTKVDLSDYATDEEVQADIASALSAYITNVTATVDANTGTPSVSTSFDAGVLTLEFHNLKGDTGPVGVTSVVATVDNTSGIPACSVSLIGTTLHLDFTGLKGDQGNTGASQDYPFELVNNETTDDATKAHSAAGAKRLKDEITQLEANQRKIFPYEAKQLLVGLLKKIAYLSADAESDVEDLEDILLNEVGLVSLQATFTQGSEEFYPGQPLDVLIPYLEVIGLYDDLSEREITNYILSGNLVAGTSTITVSYGGKTTTFTVSVTDAVYYREGSKMIRPYFLNSANQNYGPATVDGVTLVYTRSKNSGNVVQVSRACYPYFDLLLTKGKDYKWTVKATGLPTGCKISAALQYFNQSFKTDGDANLLANHSADMMDSGWLTTTINDGVITVTYGSETESSALTLIGARLNLRLLDSSDQDISWPSDCVIEKLIIQEVE